MSGREVCQWEGSASVGGKCVSMREVCQYEGSVSVGEECELEGSVMGLSVGVSWEGQWCTARTLIPQHCSFSSEVTSAMVTLC